MCWGSILILWQCCFGIDVESQGWILETATLVSMTARCVQVSRRLASPYTVTAVLQRLAAGVLRELTAGRLAERILCRDRDTHRSGPGANKYGGCRLTSIVDSRSMRDSN